MTGAAVEGAAGFHARGGREGGGPHPRWCRRPHPFVPFGRAGDADVPEGGEPPADRRVQDPRRVQRRRRRSDEEALRRGVITYSSGNHAQGVARAARLLGAPAVVVMPRDAPRIKGAARCGRRRRDRLGRALGATNGGEVAERLAAGARPARSSRPSTTPGSSPGQGTVGPGDRRGPARRRGGRRARSAAAGWRAASRRPSRRLRAVASRVIGVEPELAADARESLRDGATSSRWPAERGRAARSPTGRAPRRSAAATFAHLRAAPRRRS